MRSLRLGLGLGTGIEMECGRFPPNADLREGRLNPRQCLLCELWHSGHRAKQQAGERLAKLCLRRSGRRILR